MTELIKFAASQVPQPTESRNTTDDKYVTYGGNNLYPQFLLKLFNECGPHASIIQNKTNYIIGDGLKFSDGKDVNFQANAADNIKELLNKCVLDYLIFNYFTVEVVFNKLGEPIEYHHVPAERIRTNYNKTKFWFNEDWSYTRRHILYDRWTPHSTGTASKLFFFDGYFPSVNRVYALPEYYAAIESIRTDVAIKSFNRNNIENHFSPSAIITFFEGANVPEGIREKVLGNIKDSYTGANGGKFILDFQDSEKGKSAEVKQLSAGDWDKAYVEVGKKTMDDIFIAHQCTSPILFGVKTEGQLGGTTEMETSFNVFKATYVKVKRDALESALNLLFSQDKRIKGPLKFGDSPLFPVQTSDVLKQQIFTVNELRKEAGLPPLPNGDRLLSEAPQVAEPTQPVQPIDDVKKKSSRKLTEADYESVSHLGAHADEFEVMGEHQEHVKFGVSEDVAQYVIDNDIQQLTLEQLANLLKKDKGIDVSVNDLRDVLAGLSESGVVDVDYTDGKVKVTPSKVADVPDTDRVSVMYKYVLRLGINGPDLLPTSRSFCTKLIKNNRLYTRQEIQTMSQLFEFDVYQYAGGFYHNPETEETTPYCRHTWQPLKVKRKAA